MTPPYKGRSKQTAPKSELSDWACVSVCLERLVSQLCPWLPRQCQPSQHSQGFGNDQKLPPALGFTVKTELNQSLHGTQRTHNAILAKVTLSKWKGVITQSEKNITGNLKSLCKPVCSYFSNYAFLRGIFLVYSFSVTIIIKLLKISFETFHFQIKQNKK